MLLMLADLFMPLPLRVDLDEALVHLAEHGYARLGRVMDEPGLAELRARSDEVMLGQVRYEGLFFQLDTETGRYEDLTYKKGYQGPSLNYRKVEKLEKDPLFSAWINNPLFERVARRIYDGPIAIYRAVLFNKAARGGTVLPFHQDGGSYWGLDRDPTLQIWTALDDASEQAGCVEILPGSHKDGLATPLGGLIPREVVKAREVEGRIVKLPAAAGEAILIHNQVWHRSGVNRTDQPRRAFTVCYMSAETQCQRRKRAPRRFVRVFEREGGSPEAGGLEHRSG